MASRRRARPATADPSGRHHRGLVRPIAGRSTSPLRSWPRARTIRGSAASSIAENVTEWSGSPAAFSTHLAVGDNTSDATGGPIALELDWLSGCRVGVDCEVPVTVTFGWNAVDMSPVGSDPVMAADWYSRGDLRGLHSRCDDPAGSPAGEASRGVVGDAPNRACYAPRPIGPTGIGAGSGRSGTADVGTSGAHHRGSARPRAAGRVAGARARARVEGPAAAVGPHLPPDVLVPGELPGGPRPTPSSPATRGRGDVVLDPFSGRGTTPLQACAEGRIGVGNDLNPFAHLLTAAKVEPGDPRPGRDASRPAPPRLERGLGGLAGARRARLAAPDAADALVPTAGSGDRAGRRHASTSRSRSPSPSTRGRSASCCSSGPRSGSTTGPIGSWPPR